MKKIEFTRFIERYLDGNMQNAEKKWFEAELEGNPGLRKELELQKKVNKYVGNQDAMAFRQTLMNAEGRHRKSAAKKRHAAKQLIQYAALFAGLVLIGTMGYYLMRNSDAADAATKYSPEFTPLTASRSLPGVIDEAYTRATEYYSSGNYAEAIVWFNRIVDSDMQVEFMKGSSHMEISQYNDAIGSFSKVLEDNDNLFIEDSRFYLGICYIQTGQDESAKQILETVVNSENRHRKDARKLLRKIK
ncbi:MAG: tetratricopeptide repeat protein [Bacteroidales bacterium]|nr:tetratricopeptide repeat protein [Bacteroidales bacterium]